MQLAIGILRHARRLQDNLVERDIIAARHGGDLGFRHGIAGGADLGLDGLTGRVEAARLDDDLGDVAGRGYCLGVRCPRQQGGAGKTGHKDETEGFGNDHVDLMALCTRYCNAPCY